jgi:hypothetical protein
MLVKPETEVVETDELVDVAPGVETILDDATLQLANKNNGIKAIINLLINFI